ncbi:hypothetical protein C1701_19925 [Actinoalloteichus sp. AHMU CJ021]|uniref:phosphodiester glycosidase family protein n=1 Tax=Actinoalloteichus sp. AHMU CJ021 TaxID=2072503 RepID=UPI000CA08985|nr:hypothetical protein C1701_19925 [Actinoalloteichus sp. AHMU CJ021]
MVTPRGVRTLLCAALVTLPLAALPTATAAPDPGPPAGAALPEDGPAASSRIEPDLWAAPGGSAADLGFTVSSSTTAVAPGLELTEFARFDPNGWVEGDVLTADLSGTGLRPTYLHPGSVSDRAPLSEQVASAGAVAGVNADFFDINATGAPLGVGIDDGTLRHAPADGRNLTATFTEEGLASLTEVFLEASVTLPGGESVPASNFNSPVVADGGIGVFTPLWGESDRTTAVVGADRVSEVEVRDGRVVAVREAPSAGPVADGSQFLLGRDGGADLLGALSVGDAVGLDVDVRSDVEDIAVAVGGNRVLVRDGAVLPVDDVALHPRTAVGFSEDGERFWLVTIDGRQASSRGMTERELGHYLRSLGAHHALNLDGGGSSTMLARPVGDAEPSVRNSPSDGGERTVPNGLGLVTPEGSGELTGYRVEPAVTGADSERVLGGLGRRLVAHGHDETGAAVAATPRWSVTPQRLGQVGRGVFRARPGAPGVDGPRTVTVAAGRDGTRSEVELRVLGTPVRLGTDIGQVALAGDGAVGHFTVLGYDGDGFGTWVEPADVSLDYDRDVVRITPHEDGFAVTALVPSGSTVVEATVGGLRAAVGVSVGTEDHVLSSMDDLAAWQATGFPAVVDSAISSAPGRDGGTGIALDYGFTGTTATRAAYVAARGDLALPAGTQRIGVWINGDGRGAWPRLDLRDNGGVATILDLAAAVDWTGWRYVEATVPGGLAGPLRVHRVYLAETDGNSQYEGRVVFDDLTAAVSPVAEVPPPGAPRDPSVLGAAPRGPAGGLRVAVVSDAQFTADSPDGEAARQARRSFREALASEPDVVLINGDLVDRGFAEDFAVARRILDEELGDSVPWYYVPGNHEISGPGDISEFQAAFGAPFQVADHGGIRMVLLNSAYGTLRGGGFDQVEMLRDALDSAVSDPDVDGVLVAMHHPTVDPGPAANSRLADSREADLIAGWLTEFELESGKPAAVITAHAGLFHASRVDGVPYWINGNAGKGPSARPESGGFTGWSLLHLDPSREELPMRVEMRPHVDGLSVEVPDELAIGGTGEVVAEVHQDGRTVPVAYPVAGSWSGSDGLHVAGASTSEPGPEHVASFDPATGQVRGLRAGTASLELAVNGVTERVRVTVR